MVVTMTKAVGDVGTIADMTRNNGKWRISNGETEAEVKSCDKDMSVLGRNSYKLLVTGENTARVIRYSDLHRHSDNSLLDGMTKVDEMIEATEYSGALTDHGNMYGFLDFYTGMKAKGKKPIIGFEAYAEDLDGELHGNHLILLAKNDVGFHNLLLLCSESFDHVKRKPHVTWEMLEKYHEGVIATTACIYGAVPNYINGGDMGKARKTLERYMSLFGEDLYVEIQRHKLPEERVVNPALVELAKEYGIPVIATTDAHYLRKEDAAAHEVLLCLQTKKTLAEPHMTFPGEGYYIHTSEEMEELFADIPEALDNTLDLADKVNVTVPLGKVNMPKFEIPDGFENDDAYFTHLCKQGYSERFAGTKHENEPEYLERYNYEMEMVLKMGFSGYFLIVWDYINWARQNGIYVGPGRGSAAGSLLAFCLGITDLDPIKHNLLFERFLNPERVSMPDIDTDFEHTRRGEVIEYVRQKYGADNVAHIVTFGTMAARMAIKDVARVLGYPPALGAEIAKLIPEEVHMTIAKAMEQNPDFADRYQNDAATKRIVDIAKAVEGGKRHSSQHACGILISKDPIRNSIPTSMEIDEETGEAGLTAQVTMTQCEDLGTIKMDFLGLKNMTAIHEVVDGVVRDYGLEAILNQIGHPEAKEFRYQDIPLDDRETFEMLARGQTGGVFQLESEGMTKVIMDMFDDLGSLKDDELDQGFERLIAAVALFRPGPLDYIPDYQAGRRDRNAITYLTPELEPILKPTYGQIVFQEQVMQIVQKLAGYSLGRADVVRKAMG